MKVKKHVTWQCEIPVHLLLRSLPTHGRVVHQKVQSLLPRPAIEMKASVGHYPGGPRQLPVVQPEDLNRVVSHQVKVVAKTLGVGGPAGPVGLEGRRRSRELPEQNWVSQKIWKIGISFECRLNVMAN